MHFRITQNSSIIHAILCVFNEVHITEVQALKHSTKKFQRKTKKREKKSKKIRRVSQSNAFRNDQYIKIPMT